MKKKMIAAISMAAMMLMTPLAAAAENITKITTNVRLNKPYLNINLKTDSGTDISKVKFALKNSKGKTVATFTGANGKVSLEDKNVVDLTGIHSLASYKTQDLPEWKYLYRYYPESNAKCQYPFGKVEKNGESYNYIEAKEGFIVGPADDASLIYTDKTRFNIVEVVTVPANTLLIDVDKKVKDIKDTTSCFHLVPLGNNNQKCEITAKNKYRFYEHAGKKDLVSATSGEYEIEITNLGASGDRTTVPDHAVRYAKVRMKFNNVFPGIADDDLKVTRNYKMKNDTYPVTYDLRGNMEKIIFSSLIYSGSALTVSIPDSEGYVEFWVSEEELQAELTYNFTYGVDLENGFIAGTGGGSAVKADLPKTKEKINVLMDFPKSGYLLAALTPDKYTIVVDDKYDSKYYDLSVGSITVTDSKKMQTANIKVTKKPLLLGDVNQDGNINITDIIAVAMHIKGYKLLHSRELLTADVNGSNDINVTDMLAIAAHIKKRKLIPHKYV